MLGLEIDSWVCVMSYVSVHVGWRKSSGRYMGHFSSKEPSINDLEHQIMGPIWAIRMTCSSDLYIYTICFKENVITILYKYLCVSARIYTLHFLHDHMDGSCCVNTSICIYLCKSFPRSIFQQCGWGWRCLCIEL